MEDPEGHVAPSASVPGPALKTLLGDEPTEVTHHASLLGLTVGATGFGEVIVSADGRYLRWIPSDAAARRRPELILGPGLVLALAFQNVFCLHASAVLGPAGAVAFAGASGAGKSTLAARLAAQGSFRRLADDILPFRAARSGSSIYPHFPQLKLPPGSQYPEDAPSRHPLSRLFLLADCARGEPILERPLSPSVAALAVCGQTVASRLFPEPLLERLLQAAGHLVSHVPVSELRYPHRPDAVDEVARLIEAA